ncbi:ABC transporter ATP-binding protein [Anaerotruncus rubiinfantis]|uniref:ABC transporter ATP-binding protein n=1 Tax=Anaerotruncus rubiinfantis TaxID=1720200 RepID=UPI0034A391B0
MLRIEQLTSGYGEISIIRDISFEIRKGEIVSVIGRNGVGKSTLMKTLIGLIRNKSGKIYFEEKDITAAKAYERAQMGIGYVPQGHGVFPLLSVEENLRMGSMINRAELDKSLDIAYEYFPRLGERRTQKAGTLSGGEQAMLSIARALVGRPKLILLDEPSEGIQPNLAQQIGEIVQRCSQDMGFTIMLCEQHMGLIQQVSQRCYAIDKGTIVGTVEGEEIKDYNKIKKYLTV